MFFRTFIIFYYFVQVNGFYSDSPETTFGWLLWKRPPESIW